MTFVLVLRIFAAEVTSSYRLTKCWLKHEDICPPQRAICNSARSYSQSLARCTIFTYFLHVVQSQTFLGFSSHPGSATHHRSSISLYFTSCGFLFVLFFPRGDGNPLRGILTRVIKKKLMNYKVKNKFMQLKMATRAHLPKQKGSTDSRRHWITHSLSKASVQKCAVHRAFYAVCQGGLSYPHWTAHRWMAKLCGPNASTARSYDYKRRTNA